MFKEFMEYYQEMKEYEDPEQEEEVDEEELPNAQPMFGVNVNEQSTRVEAVEGTYAPFSDNLLNNSYLSNTRDALVEVHVPPSTAAAPSKNVLTNAHIDSGNNPVISGNVPLASGTTPGTSNATLLPLPDASLPLPSLRPPKNWDPDPSVLSWAVTTLDTCE